jgi:hypothetical protein
MAHGCIPAGPRTKAAVSSVNSHQEDADVQPEVKQAHFKVTALLHTGSSNPCGVAKVGPTLAVVCQSICYGCRDFVAAASN